MSSTEQAYRVEVIDSYISVVDGALVLVLKKFNGNRKVILSALERNNSALIDLSSKGYIVIGKGRCIDCRGSENSPVVCWQPLEAIGEEDDDE